SRPFARSGAPTTSGRPPSASWPSIPAAATRAGCGGADVAPMGSRGARRSRCAIVVRPWRGCGRLPVSRRVLVLVLACPAALVPGCYVDYVAGERVDTQAAGTTATGTTASGSGTTASLDADTTAVTTTVA